ncbi:UvrD-helicase domain-containing protein [Butyrivibrio sp. MC2013]|uniref:UvrD-helicase domain-containing protein n=1 Tax=Butyrivibrio sp. MC2013 TaxID=1280686 RepID=UPI000417428A|nr:ATP-dependent helicase [Butyrivibrio sp. MC2013]
MRARYSALFFKKDLQEHLEEIKVYLKEGIKVFWFGSPSDIEALRERFGVFVKDFFLQLFDITEVEGVELYSPNIIIDGLGITDDERKSELFYWAEKNIPAFNAAQYRVEHCLSDANIVVKASAGTGKTTVMIDRILYLMHTVPNLLMSEIYMITFTNEATNQMNARLQEMLLKKYSLTKNKRYLSWLEQQSQMHISTIDSLAYDLFRKFGTGVGFGRDIAIRPLEKDRKDLIKDILSDKLSDQKTITSQIGITYPEAGKLIDDYWKELTRKGYTITEVLRKDWGDSNSEPVIAGLQKVIQAVLHDFEERYRQLKLDENTISINDLFFDFGHYLLDERLKCDGLDMKYLFVDEFQDTDSTQIRTFARLVKNVGAKLFVVGDVKQSIYAFKGATAEAFDILDDEMDGKLQYFSLRNNYRTCANIMRIMEKYFFAWSYEGLLGYEEPVRPFNREPGTVQMDYIEKKDTIPRQTMEVINCALDDLELEVRSGKKKVTEKTKVAVLVRGNKKASEIAELCRTHGKTVVLNSDRPFFLSRAVRDFYAMISSFIFPDHPIYTYNYLMTPYAIYDGIISTSEMERLHGDKKALNEYLNKFTYKKTHYQKEFRLRPVLAVVKEIVENEEIIQRYIAMDKVHMQGEGWTEAKRNRQALIDAKSYQVNLDKLMDMIQQRMEGEFATLYDLYVYLSLMIATNREEMEPDLDMENDYTSVYIMTVHKSKGLEFDTVILPAMNNGLIPREDTNILVDDKKVAWCYLRNVSGKMTSAWYDELRKEEIQKGIEEETRMLYVAMTRAVNRLVLLVNNWDMYESWSSLIRRVGLINE